jgi:hypothetical protein
LLRQPNRFEGFLVARVDLQLDYQVVPKRHSMFGSSKRKSGKPLALKLSYTRRTTSTFSADIPDKYSAARRIQEGSVGPAGRALRGRILFPVTAQAILDSGATKQRKDGMLIVGFEEHIKPLFRESDRESMEFAFDLWSHDEVAENSGAILERLRDGTMPCDGAWPDEQIRVFQSWVDAGMPA